MSCQNFWKVKMRICFQNIFRPQDRKTCLKSINCFTDIYCLYYFMKGSKKKKKEKKDSTTINQYYPLSKAISNSMHNFFFIKIPNIYIYIYDSQNIWNFKFKGEYYKLKFTEFQKIFQCSYQETCMAVKRIATLILTKLPVLGT